MCPFRRRPLSVLKTVYALVYAHSADSGEPLMPAGQTQELQRLASQAPANLRSLSILLVTDLQSAIVSLMRWKIFCDSPWDILLSGGLSNRNYIQHKSFNNACQQVWGHPYPHGERQTSVFDQIGYVLYFLRLSLTDFAYTFWIYLTCCIHLATACFEPGIQYIWTPKVFS